MKKDIDDLLQEGIYGAKEINPSERKLFLGSLRERVLLALTKGQVMKNKGLQQLDGLMKEHKDSTLLLNGNVSYRFFKQYRALASKNKIPYTSVKNKQAKSDFGAVLTLNYAIDKEDIELNEEPVNSNESKKKEKKSFFGSLFKR
ncbi:YueI family protein [Aquibacillus koreensis]|uniref:YueI family protein n=1 Tax=Aquibacillus koreensis TaxID=279446 RepID=A0A9X4AL58_9BACI|nr:YueI family protein [Aquibacillus koreensis]MCT2536155.1 YueI family protein [Aquibacillus koreensis]MDC3422080.1 YueI family protein [Aquibacillus koreensis]